MSTSRVPWLYRMVRDRSGQSEPVAVVLVLLVVVMATATVFITGSAAVQDGRKQVAISQAEQAFMDLDSKTSLAALAESEQQRVNLGLDETGGSLSVTTDGHILVEMIDPDTGEAIVVDGGGNQKLSPLVDQSLGTVTYEYDGTVVAYQGGGVWRSDGEGSVLVSRPEFHYRDSTLTIPVFSLSGDSSVESSVALSPGSTTKIYPDPSDTTTVDGKPVKENELLKSQIRITVTSDYYEAWYRYFDEITNGGIERGTVTKNDGERTVSMILDAKQSFVTLNDGIVATSPSANIKINGGSNHGAKVDSYDSNEGTYQDHLDSLSGSDPLPMNEATFVSSGLLDIRGTTDISGGITAREVDTGGDAIVSEFINYVDTLDEVEEAGVDDVDIVFDGEISHLDSIETIDANDDFVKGRVKAIKTSNNNGATTLIENNVLDFASVPNGDTPTLSAGTYYLDHMTVDEDTVLDTTGGDITIAVEDYVRVLGSGTTLAVNGPGTVTIYVAGTDTPTNGNSPGNLYLSDGASVVVPDDNTAQLRVYGTSEFIGYLQSSAGNQITFQGVIFAPSENVVTNGKQVEPGVYIKHANVYGAVMSGTLEIGEGTNFHYDAALDDVKLRVADDGTTIAFFHVTVHEITVSDD